MEELVHLEREGYTILRKKQGNFPVPKFLEESSVLDTSSPHPHTFNLGHRKGRQTLTTFHFSNDGSLV